MAYTEVWLADVLERINGQGNREPDGHTLPWHWKAERDQQMAHQGRLAA